VSNGAAPLAKPQESGWGVCGTGASTAIVPDFVCFDSNGGRSYYKDCVARSQADGSRDKQDAFVVQVDFTRACSAHDACYGTRNAAKDACDASFYRDLRVECRSQLDSVGDSGISNACYEVALLFNDAVRDQEAVKAFGWEGEAAWQPRRVGRTGCDSYVRGQRAAGVENPSCTGEATADGADEQAQHEYSYDPPPRPKQFEYQHRPESRRVSRENGLRTMVTSAPRRRGSGGNRAPDAGSGMPPRRC
jgi:hypothetical protein